MFSLSKRIADLFYTLLTANYQLGAKCRFRKGSFLDAGGVGKGTIGNKRFCYYYVNTRGINGYQAYLWVPVWDLRPFVEEPLFNEETNARPAENAVQAVLTRYRRGVVTQAAVPVAAVVSDFQDEDDD